MKIWVALTLASAAIASPATQRPDPPPESAPAPAAAPAPTPATIDLGEAENRMTVPVSIGTSGPWPFIIDTGAERSVVSRELATTLGLAAGRRVRVTTMAGTRELDTYRVPLLRAGTVTPAPIEAPAVNAVDLGAQGMLGIDALRDRMVAIDFDRAVMEVRPASRRRMTMGSDDIVVHARSKLGQLIVADARYRGRRVSVVVDTGASVSVGNAALMRRLHGDTKLGQVRLLTVTGQALMADYRTLDRVVIGGIGFNNVPVAFADAAPFARFGLSDTPALLLGMDTLKLFRRVEIDFANREIRFTLPRSVTVSPLASR